MRDSTKCMFLSGLFIATVIVFFYLSAQTIDEGFRTFAECRADGYTKEFCLQTPTSLFGPAGCVCPDGSQGVIHPGLRGECLCSRYF